MCEKEETKDEAKTYSMLVGLKHELSSFSFKKRKTTYVYKPHIAHGQPLVFLILLVLLFGLSLRSSFSYLFLFRLKSNMLQPIIQSPSFSHYILSHQIINKRLCPSHRTSFYFYFVFPFRYYNPSLNTSYV